MDLTPILKESFTQYSGAVLQSRALVDVRDCLKPSARQIFYCLYTDKFLHSKPFKKTLKGIGSAMRMYIHGDSSCEGVIMRAGQPFAMRYPLIEVEGSYGNLMESGNWAAPRYTASRLSNISNYLFEDITKKTINEWRDNYDDTEQYPAVLPTKGFYNIVNGTMGIGIGMSSSIPQFNLKEVNEALIKLLWNSNCSFEDIYCAPDFATGGILLNEEEVKESLKNGTGKSCKLRSVIEFDQKERCFIVTEIPYSVYTNTICGELEKILEESDNPGIERFNDLTGSTPLIKIYLSKKANPDRVLRYLYKNTSLQYYYGINMTMLENGRFPKVFTWKGALEAHLIHEIEVYTQGFIFDLNKIKSRIHIIEGLLKAISILDEVIALIKGASDTHNASLGLQQVFGFSETQAKAILDIKLARLAKLEINKLEKEKSDLEIERARIENILSHEELLKKEIEKGLREVSEKFGDSRRTKILNIETENDEPTEIRSLLINLTNQNNIFVSEASSLYIQKRGGVGNKFKLNDGEYVISTSSAKTTDTILFFSQVGNFYHYQAGAIPIDEKLPIESLFLIKSYERICNFTSFNSDNLKKNIIFFTKNGMMKKSLLSEYNIKRAGGAKALDLENNDEICSVIFVNEEKVGILTEFGQFLICETKDIRAVGRIAKGVKAIKLNENDSITSARTIPEGVKEFVSVTGNGYIKRTSASEFVVTGRYTKGGKLQKLKDESDYLIDFLPILSENNLIITSTSAQIKVDIKDISLLGKGAQGTKSLKMKDKDKIIGLSKF
jgi:DNA gyrase subunit A